MRLFYAISETPLDKPAQRALARRLLRHAVGENHGEIAVGENGKPYFADGGVKFNYAHCKYGAVCAVGESEVGADIQEIRQVRPRVIRRVCSDEEIRIIEESADSDEEFIRIWTMKEAYAKFTGRGLSENFRLIDTTKSEKWTVFRAGNCCVACYPALCCNSTAEELLWEQVSPP